MGNSIFLSLPDDVKFIIEKLSEAGYEAYAVGGCIRDMILGRKPNDFDVTTSAGPEKVKAIFRRTVDTGIEHGTVTVLIKDKGYEVTTYRIDGEYEDNRHPKSVSFTSSLTEDLLRRDFTINAMAYNDRDGLKDPFDGLGDIERKLIRCVGDPKDRFGEDALRILRAVRFSAQLGYDIEEETVRAIRLLADNLKDISAERIRVELEKMLTSDNPGVLLKAYEYGITRVFLPEFDVLMDTPQNNRHHRYSVGMHTLKSVEYIRNDRILRLTMLFHDIGKPLCKKTDEFGIDHFHSHPAESEKIARRVLRRLKFDNNTVDTVCELTFLHDLNIETTPAGVRRAVNMMGKENYARLMEIKEADFMAQSEYKRQEKVERLNKLKELFEEVLKREECTSLNDLKIGGKELLEIGYPKGPKVGAELKRLLDKVIEDPLLNDHEMLLKLAREDFN